MPKAFSLTRIYQLLIVALTLLLLWKWNCGAPCPAIQETTKIDTFYRESKDSSKWSKPQPVAVHPGKMPIQIIPVTKGGELSYDTLYLPVDTAAILAAYYNVTDYDTSYHFPEGNIRVQNYVSQNMLQGQRVLPDFIIPEITKTITVSQKPKGRVFVGLDAYGGSSNPVYGAGIAAMWMTKKGKVYEAGPVIFKDQPLMWKVGAKFLISIHK